MRRTSMFLTMVVAILAALPIVAKASSSAQPGYIALGDSIDAGVGGGTTYGWVRLFRDEALDPDVELHMLAVSGADTRAILRDQLPVAVSEVTGHAPYGVVVTIGGGGVDLRRFLKSPTGQECVRTYTCLPVLEVVLDGLEWRMDDAVRQLRAADPGATILIRTQYNPLRRTGCASAAVAAFGDTALDGEPGDDLEGGGLNWRLRGVAARHGALVIEISDTFAAQADTLIRSDCLHPTEDGHRAISDAAVDALAEGANR